MYGDKPVCRICNHPIHKVGNKWIHDADGMSLGVYVRVSRTHEPWPVPKGVVIPVKEQQV